MFATRSRSAAEVSVQLVAVKQAIASIRLKKKSLKKKVKEILVGLHKTLECRKLFLITLISN